MVNWGCVCRADLYGSLLLCAGCSKSDSWLDVEKLGSAWRTGVGPGSLAGTEAELTHTKPLAANLTAHHEPNELRLFAQALDSTVKPQFFWNNFVINMWRSSKLWGFSTPLVLHPFWLPVLFALCQDDSIAPEEKNAWVGCFYRTLREVIRNEPYGRRRLKQATNVSRKLLTAEIRV